MSYFDFANWCPLGPKDQSHFSRLKHCKKLCMKLLRKGLLRYQFIIVMNNDIMI